MLVFHLNENVPLFIDYVEASFRAILWHFPTSTCILENVLVEIANAVVVGLVNLTKAFRLYRLAQVLTVNLRVERQFYRVNEILVERIQVYTPAVLHHCRFNVTVYFFVGNES